MEKKFYKPQDFLIDSKFRRWIPSPDKDLNRFWEGTAFNIKAYPQDGKVDIALVSGMVRVEYQDQVDQPVILNPGECLSYDASTRHVIKGPIDPNSNLVWRNGIIHFNNASESEVIEKLERWYGVKFSFNNRLAKRWSYSGEFNNKSLENVLLSIGFTMDFHFTITNKNVKVTYN